MHLILKQPYKVGTAVVPILHVRKLRQEVKYSALGHIAGKWIS